MAGHSKWAKVKHQKSALDPKRGQLFTKLTREITVAAKEGGGSPEANVRLRLAIQKAKDNNMPLENIERAIKRGTGESAAQYQLEEITYEGYGPGGAAILLQALTDNRNRTASEVRAAFAKHGGNLGEAGCVSWLFEKKGVIVVESPAQPAEELALLAIDAGAEDFSVEDSTLELSSSPESFESLRKALEQNGIPVASADISMVPKSTVVLKAKAAEQALRLLDRLEDLDDVYRVYSNAEFPDEVLERYQREG